MAQTRRQFLGTQRASFRRAVLSGEEGARLKFFFNVKGMGSGQDPDELINFLQGDVGAQQLASNRGAGFTRDLKTLQALAFKKANLADEATFNAFLDEGKEVFKPASGTTPASRAAEGDLRGDKAGTAASRVVILPDGTRLTGEAATLKSREAALRATQAVQTAARFGAEPGVSGSIVDFLKSKGVASDFGSRANLFAQLGGQGEFRGTAEQNLALLGTLSRAERDAGLTLTSQNFQNIISGFGQTPTPGTTPSTTAGGGAASIGTFGGGVPSGLTDLARTAAGGSFPSADDIFSQAREGFEESPGFQLRSQEAEATRSRINVQSARDIKSFIQDQALAGLTFSGGRIQGVKEREAEKLADLSGIDRDLALVLVQGIEKGIQDIVKEAEKGEQRAQDAMKALGLVNVDGQLVKTAAQEEREFQRGLDITREQRLQGQAELSFSREQRIANEGFGLSSTDLQQVNAFTEQILQGGNFTLENVPSSLRGSVAVNLMDRQRVQPQEFTDDEFRTMARAAIGNNITVKEAIQQINQDPTILNKERAVLVVNEIYNEQEASRQGGGGFFDRLNALLPGLR